MRSTREADALLAPVARVAGASALARLLALLLVAAPAATGSAAEPDLAYRDALIARARAEDLAAAPGWLRLLHVRRAPLTRRPRSHVDDPAFFLAEDGDRDPEAELVATLEAFFAAGSSRADGQPAACAYPARFRWLDAHLDFDPARLPRPPCPLFEAVRANIGQVTGVTLVFAEAFMNNPASMFGHTLLRIDTTESRSGDLLGWAVNFAGATGADAGPLYALKGVFGAYPGYYGIAPYYEKVKEYGDWEDRDIWEYRLAFGPDDIERLLEHLWEMQGVAFDYWYFDENCSYQLMALLETARPGLELTAGFPLWVIPADTVRAVVEQAGLLESVRWRPSAATRLAWEAEQLPAGGLALARRIADGETGPEAPEVQALPEDGRAAVLSVAYDWLRHRYLASDVGREESAARARAILVARSRVAVSGPVLSEPRAPAVRPDQGHRSARAALAGGWRGDRAYLELRLRPAFHDLLDAEGGYTRGAEVQLLDLALRWYPGRGDVRLQEAVLVDLVSLVPWTRLFRPVSYRFDTGLRTRVRDRDDLSVWRTRGGAGLTGALGERGLVYGLGEGVFDVSGALDSDVALGGGGRLGVLVGTPGDRWRADLYGEAVRFFAGDATTWLRAGVDQRIALTRDTALRLEGSWNRDFGDGWAEGALRFDVHF